MSDLKGIEAIAYQLDLWGHGDIDVRLENRRNMPGKPDRWAISEKDSVLNKDGDWEYEPLPSSRDDEYFARTRFGSAEEALNFWRMSGYKSRFEHYRARSEAQS